MWTLETVAHRMAPHAPGVAKVPNDGRLTAAQVFRALNEVRPANTVLIEESPSNLPDLHATRCPAELVTGTTFHRGVGMKRRGFASARV